jgi:hypothetical protein
MATDEEWERFNAWCREEAAEIRNYAAAFGETVEYRYLKVGHILRLKMRERFPNLTEMLIDSVWSECRNPDLPLDLVQINKHRAKFEYPAIGFIPPLRLEEEHRAPMPGDAPEPPPPPGPSFYEWAVAKLILIRHSAVAKGADVEREFLETQPMLINAIYRNFPDMGPAMGLTFMRMWVHDKAVTEAPLDEERLRGMRLWCGALQEVADEVEARMRGDTTLPPKALPS